MQLDMTIDMHIS